MEEKDEFTLIARITDRAQRLAEELNVHYPRATIFMDINNVHERTPLRLEELLNAPKGQFAHDIFGIRAHFNRETLEMEDFFSPRYTL
jgi:hypothetical protein